ncbi:hypothetical protein NP493_555g01060 [Ridgeia piscesae]|uniref:Uncharacterized protein n=1 Tax=Ridgeia piscesae TaxID=27915 RepID=A0AAD9KVM1_RIDPI|nr:hypothetical protein NP493_555g01060 [Ridgeia piscesae]
MAVEFCCTGETAPGHVVAEVATGPHSHQPRTVGAVQHACECTRTRQLQGQVLCRIQRVKPCHQRIQERAYDAC